jgi:hypothetical protein
MSQPKRWPLTILLSQLARQGHVFLHEAIDDNDIVEPEVILGHPTLRDPRDVSLDEAMGTTRWALTVAQNVLHRESGGIVDDRQRLMLWASMLKEWTTAERARAEAR